ncbi:hypothetical protein QQ045_026667 [Rhodiola kirilowii]
MVIICTGHVMLVFLCIFIYGNGNQLFIVSLLWKLWTAWAAAVSGTPPVSTTGPARLHTGRISHPRTICKFLSLNYAKYQKQKTETFIKVVDNTEMQFVRMCDTYPLCEQNAGTASRASSTGGRMLPAIPCDVLTHTHTQLNG